MNRIVRASAAFAVAALAAAPRAAAPSRIMLLDGESGGPYHRWRVTTPVLKKMLDETRSFRDRRRHGAGERAWDRVRAAVRRLRRRRVQLRCARRALARGAEGGVRPLHRGGRRTGGRACRRQRLSRMESVQRHDRRRRMARPRRTCRPAMVRRRRQAGRRPFAGIGRQPRHAAAVRDHLYSTRITRSLEAFRKSGCIRATSCMRRCAVRGST